MFRQFVSILSAILLLAIQSVAQTLSNNQKIQTVIGKIQYEDSLNISFHLDNPVYGSLTDLDDKVEIVWLKPTTPRQRKQLKELHDQKVNLTAHIPAIADVPNYKLDLVKQIISVRKYDYTTGQHTYLIDNTRFLKRPYHLPQPIWASCMAL